MDFLLGMALHTNIVINFTIITVVIIITSRRTCPRWSFASQKNLRNKFGYNWNPLPQIETAALGAISESFVIVYAEAAGTTFYSGIPTSCPKFSCW